MTKVIFRGYGRAVSMYAGAIMPAPASAPAACGGRACIQTVMNRGCRSVSGRHTSNLISCYNAVDNSEHLSYGEKN